MKRALVLVTAVLVLTGCASAKDAHTGVQESISSSVAASSATVVSAASKSAPPPATPIASTAASSAAPTETSDGSFVMPNEVGKVLQAAQDDIQRVSGDPVFVSHSSDATGASRLQVLDRNWKVCSQNLAAGAKASAIEHIVFNVVKLEESCP